MQLNYYDLMINIMLKLDFYLLCNSLVTRKDISGFYELLEFKWTEKKWYRGFLYFISCGVSRSLICYGFVY